MRFVTSCHAILRSKNGQRLRASRTRGFEVNCKRETPKDGTLNVLQNGYLEFAIFGFLPKTQNSDFLKINDYQHILRRCQHCKRLNNTILSYCSRSHEPLRHKFRATGGVISDESDVRVLKCPSTLPTLSVTGPNPGSSTLWLFSLLSDKKKNRLRGPKFTLQSALGFAISRTSKRTGLYICFCHTASDQTMGSMWPIALVDVERIVWGVSQSWWSLLKNNWLTANWTYFSNALVLQRCSFLILGFVLSGTTWCGDMMIHHGLLITALSNGLYSTLWSQRTEQSNPHNYSWGSSTSQIPS